MCPNDLKIINRPLNILKARFKQGRYKKSTQSNGRNYFSL